MLSKYHPKSNYCTQISVFYGDLTLPIKLHLIKETNTSRIKVKCQPMTGLSGVGYDFRRLCAAKVKSKHVNNVQRAWLCLLTVHRINNKYPYNKLTMAGRIRIRDKGITSCSNNITTKTRRGYGPRDKTHVLICWLIRE